LSSIKFKKFLDNDPPETAQNA